MTDGVEDTKIEDVTVEGVVEAVAGHLVCGLEKRGDGDSFGLQDERREEIPLHAGPQRQRLATAVEVVEIR